LRTGSRQTGQEDHIRPVDEEEGRTADEVMSARVALQEFRKKKE
jgi:hypothetical protein